MLGVACLVAAFGNINSLILASGFSFGISPSVYAYLTGPVSDTIDAAFRLLAINVVMARLIPANIEASMFAIQTGIQNFCNFFLAKQLGNLFNLPVGVTDEDTSQLWLLLLITYVLSFIPLAFLWLAPHRKEVFLVQEVNEFQEKYPPKRYDFNNDTQVRSAIDEDEDDVSSSEDRTEIINAIMKLDPKVATAMGVYELYADELGESFEHPVIDDLPGVVATMESGQADDDE